MSDDAQNAPPQPPSEEEAQFQAFMQGQVNILLETAAAFVPPRNEREVQILRAICERCLTDQFSPSGLGQMMRDAADPASRVERPFWGVFVKHGDGELKVIAPKDVAQCATPEEMFAYLVIAGLVSSPLVRVICAANRHDLRFVQVKEWADRPRPKPKLIV